MFVHQLEYFMRSSSSRNASCVIYRNFYVKTANLSPNLWVIKSVYKWRHLTYLLGFFYCASTGMALSSPPLINSGSWKLSAAMRQEGAHLWKTRLWQYHNLIIGEIRCLCCTHANAWSWSLHPPVLLCQVLSKPSQGKRVLQGSTSRSISDLERRSCWTRQTQIWLSHALMLCENAGKWIEFKLLSTDDQQMKCCSSPPLSSRQDLINSQFCHISQKRAFTGPVKVLPV